jgi:predicted nucleic acid-binding protein
VTLVLDASVLVAVFWPDDTQHTTSRAWIERQVDVGEALLIPALALPEVAGPIRRRTGQRMLSRQALDDMLNIPGVTVVSITEDLGKLAADLASELSLKGGEAVYAALALMEGVTLVSWDREHLERCPGRIEVRTPNQ